MPHRCLFKRPIWAFTTASSYYKKPPTFTFPLLYSNQTHHNKRRPKGKLSSLSNLFSLIRNNKKPWRWAVLAWEPQREDHYQAEGLEESWESKGLSFTLYGDASSCFFAGMINESLSLFGLEGFLFLFLFPFLVDCK